MKIAALYDIHGNLPALEAVLKEIDREGVDIIVVGGDLVPGPMSLDVLEVLQNMGNRMKWIRGNCEREVVEFFDGGAVSYITSKEVFKSMEWTARQMERKQRDFMAALPE